MHRWLIWLCNCLSRKYLYIWLTQTLTNWKHHVYIGMLYSIQQNESYNNNQPVGNFELVYWFGNHSWDTVSLTSGLTDYLSMKRIKMKLKWSMRDDNASIVLSSDLWYTIFSKKILQKKLKRSNFSSLIETLRWQWAGSLHTLSSRWNIKSIEPHPKRRRRKSRQSAFERDIFAVIVRHHQAPSWDFLVSTLCLDILSRPPHGR